MRKFISFIAGTIVASIAVSTTGVLWVGLLAAGAVGGLKEIFDYYNKNKEPSFYDFAAVLLGGLSATFGLFFWI